MHRPSTRNVAGAVRNEVGGQGVIRPDARDKVTGEATYTGDISLPGMLYGAIVASPAASGSIKAIDASRAAAMPGVCAIITAEDLLDPTGRIHCAEIRFGVTVRDRPILADGRVRYIGEPVAAVAAVDARTAEAAARSISVAIAEEPGAVTLDSAIAAGAPIVHGRTYEPESGGSETPGGHGDSSNLGFTTELCEGDVDAAFAAAQEVLDDVYEFPSTYQYAMEPHTAVASIDARTVRVWSTAQHPYQVQKDLARLFGLPLAAVRVVVPLIGGGFGSKSFTHIEPLAVALAKAAAAPVMLRLDVSEAMSVSRRHGARAMIRSAVDEMGRLSAIDAEIFLEGGAYSLTGPGVARRAAYRLLGAYKFGAYRVRCHMVYTNRSPAGSFRAIGGPQATWAIESHIEHVGAVLGRSGRDVRLECLATRGEPLRPGRTPMTSDARECLARVCGEPGGATSGKQEEDGGIAIGTGVALGVAEPGASPVSTAVVRIAADGSLSVLVGSSELGQGAHTVMAQITARELAVPISTVQVVQPDTATGPYDFSTGSSRSTTIGGLAVLRAARKMREKLVGIAATSWGVEPEPLAVEGGMVVAADRRATLGDVVSDYFGEPGGSLVTSGEVTRADFPTSPYFWEVCAGRASVRVDRETGVVQVVDYASVADVGKAINRVLLEGQEQGALVQGIGHTLCEELVWSGGELQNSNLLEYRVPRFDDIPEHLSSAFIENEDGPGPFGSKGAGEGAIMPVAPAIANAIFEATGARITELPLRPAMVWRHLQSLRPTSVSRDEYEDESM